MGATLTREWFTDFVFFFETICEFSSNSHPGTMVTMRVCDNVSVNAESGLCMHPHNIFRINSPQIKSKFMVSNFWSRSRLQTVLLTALRTRHFYIDPSN
jgi:hypothetical protein